jgi:hypothetical protein
MKRLGVYAGACFPRPASVDVCLVAPPICYAALGTLLVSLILIQYQCKDVNCKELRAKRK